MQLHRVQETQLHLGVAAVGDVLLFLILRPDLAENEHFENAVNVC